MKNQGRCGSCWAFSAAGAIESQHFRKTGKLVSLSEQNIVDCSKGEGTHGCHGGWMDDAFRYVQKNGGVDTENAYPYKAAEGNCHYSAKNKGATVAGIVDIKSNDEKELEKAIANVGPVAVAIDASGLQFYFGGVYDNANCNPRHLNHAVLAVGYGTEKGKQYYLAKNSWGKTWGSRGFVKMVRNHGNRCGIASRASYPKV